MIKLRIEAFVEPQMPWGLRDHAPVEKGIVRWYNAEKGWGVLDSDATPGGCAVIFMMIQMEGYKLLSEGQSVRFTFEPGPQDGYAYRAVRVWPE